MFLRSIWMTGYFFISLKLLLELYEQLPLGALHLNPGIFSLAASPIGYLSQALAALRIS